MNEKIFHIREGSQAIKLLKEMIEMIKQDRVPDLIVIAAVKDDPEPGLTAIHNYWHGEHSTLYCLGLIQRMKDIISDYIRERSA